MSTVFKGLPGTIRIGWADYTVRLLPADEAHRAGLFGESLHGAQEITLADDQSGLRAANTVLHEIIHAVRRIGEMQEGDNDERETAVVANGLMQVWRDNPEFVAWFTRLVAASGAR